MITLHSIDPTTQQRAVRARGGFLWWYLDLVDGFGNGAVLIWSFGLPFLPDYTAAAREGCAPEARDRPSLNVAIYRNGQLDCYLLREYRREEVDWSPGKKTWRFGPNRAQTRLRNGIRRVRLELDCAVPGTDERLTGRIDAHGVAPRSDSLENTGRPRTSSHVWSPLAVRGEGYVNLEFGDCWSCEFRGSAYHDANAGTRPLEAIGIDQWHWGRLRMPDYELVYYALWGDRGAEPTAFAVLVGDDGRLQLLDDLDVELGESRRNVAGLQWWTSTTLHPRGTRPSPTWRIHHCHPVDSGPFYMRFLTEAKGVDRRVVGVSELIRPGRVDLARHRPFVRMRVDQPSRGNSMWLPLFSGPREGRLERLLRYNLPGGGRDVGGRA